MTEATATVRMDEQGRAVVPQPVREKLGVDDLGEGEKALLEATFRADDAGEGGQ